MRLPHLVEQRVVNLTSCTSNVQDENSRVISVRRRRRKRRVVHPNEYILHVIRIYESGCIRPARRADNMSILSTTHAPLILHLSTYYTLRAINSNRRGQHKNQLKHNSIWQWNYVSHLHIFACSMYHDACTRIYTHAAYYTDCSKFAT